MAKSTVKGESRNTKQKEKPKERRLPVPRFPAQWKVGDEIVTSTDKMGYVTSTITIRTLTTGYGCKNLHVNGTACYDRSLPWPIAVNEAEALDILAGVDTPNDLLARVDALFGEDY